jgi:hypothetical protein
VTQNELGPGKGSKKVMVAPLTPDRSTKVSLAGNALFKDSKLLPKCIYQHLTESPNLLQQMSKQPIFAYPF